MFTDYKPAGIRFGSRIVALNEPVVMGILNATPDSFYDGGKYRTADSILKQCGKMLEEGAFILDLGGQSSRPGAEMCGEMEEINRIVPMLREVKKHFPSCLVSIDTFRAEVARRAVLEGADLVNDISAGDDDPGMLAMVAGLKVPYIAMHKKGRPADMQKNPAYHDVVGEVKTYLKNKIEVCRQTGINDIIIDPGFGFGKKAEHNYTLLKNLDAFQELGCPVLAGISRKSMIWKLLKTNPEQALNGSSAAHTIALLNGAHILRVHDVKEALECIRIVTALRKN